MLRPRQWTKIGAHSAPPWQRTKCALFSRGLNYGASAHSLAISLAHLGLESLFLCSLSLSLSPSHSIDLSEDAVFPCAVLDI